MLVRKNTKAFKTILEILTACQDRADRDKLVRLYITKAGDSIGDRISTEGIQGDAALFYEMTYQTVLNNLKSSSHQLQVSEEVPGIYFFHSTSNKAWDETPFEFDESIKTEFASLPELPMVRRKEAPKKFVLPSAESKGSVTRKKTEKPAKKQRQYVGKASQPDLPTIPDFKLEHQIGFTNIDKLVFRQAKVTKLVVLEYYSKISEYLLPWLRDRPLSARLQTPGVGKVMPMTIDALFRDDEMPLWVKTVEGSSKKKGDRLLLCNDRDHLMLYAERGCLEFIPAYTRTSRRDCPDYIVIGIDSPDAGLAKAIDATLTAHEILTGLKLPSFLRTDGVSGFHIYIPLDAKSDLETGRKCAEYICKLIALKIPDAINLKGMSGYVYGKVSLDYSFNERGVTAPYSLVAGDSPIVATPLRWDELTKGLRAEDFDHHSVLKRVEESGDPFQDFFKKKVSASDLSQRLAEHYGFLF